MELSTEMVTDVQLAKGPSGAKLDVQLMYRITTGDDIFKNLFRGLCDIGSGRCIRLNWCRNRGSASLLTCHRRLCTCPPPAGSAHLFVLHLRSHRGKPSSPETPVGVNIL